MRAGALDRRVELQHRTLTRNTTTGEEVETWSTYATVWAEKKDVRGREFFAAQQSNSDITTTWRIRYRGDVVATDKLTHAGLSYNITSISEIGRHDGIELQATAVRP